MCNHTIQKKNISIYMLRVIHIVFLKDRNALRVRYIRILLYSVIILIINTHNLKKYKSF